MRTGSKIYKGDFMIFEGYSKTFSTKKNQQFQTIGAFWDTMSALCGRENLRGLGYNWSIDSIDYVIGLKSNEKIELQINEMQAEWKKIILPDAEWKHYHGKTNELGKLYEKIYKEGNLTYEIEEFNEDGTCIIMITRDLN